MTKKILLTGGAGYIRSHTYLALINSGFDIVCKSSTPNGQIVIVA